MPQLVVDVVDKACTRLECSVDVPQPGGSRALSAVVLPVSPWLLPPLPQQQRRRIRRTATTLVAVHDRSPSCAGPIYADTWTRESVAVNKQQRMTSGLCEAH